MQSCRLFSSTTYKANTGIKVPLHLVFIINLSTTRIAFQVLQSAICT
jgi:hypothetical protein